MDSTPPIADLGPLNRAREQKAWFFYDWANSAFATTIAGVLFAPYLITHRGAGRLRVRRRRRPRVP